MRFSGQPPACDPRVGVRPPERQRVYVPPLSPARLNPWRGFFAYMRLRRGPTHNARQVPYRQRTWALPHSASQEDAVTAINSASPRAPGLNVARNLHPPERRSVETRAGPAENPAKRSMATAGRISPCRRVSESASLSSLHRTRRAGRADAPSERRLFGPPGTAKVNRAAKTRRWVVLNRPLVTV